VCFWGLELVAAVWALLVGNKFPFSHEQQLTASADDQLNSTQLASTRPDIRAGRWEPNERASAAQ